MTVELEVKKTQGPPPVPPRHNKEYYQNSPPSTPPFNEKMKIAKEATTNNNPQKSNLSSLTLLTSPPATPARISSRVIGGKNSNSEENFLEAQEKNSAVLKNDSQKTDLTLINSSSTLYSQNSLTTLNTEDTPATANKSTLEEEIMNDLAKLSEKVKLSMDTKESQRTQNKSSQKSSTAAPPSPLPLPKDDEGQASKPVKLTEETSFILAAINQSTDQEADEKALKTTTSTTTSKNIPTVKESDQDSFISARSHNGDISSTESPIEPAMDGLSLSQAPSSTTLASPEQQEDLSTTTTTTTTTEAKSIPHPIVHKFSTASTSSSTSITTNASSSPSSLEKKDDKENKSSEKAKSRDVSAKKEKDVLPVVPVIENEQNNNEEIESLRQREKTQREYVIKEQKTLNELHQQQYLLLQQQYALAVQNKKQFNLAVQNCSPEQLNLLQQQQEQNTMALQNNQKMLMQKVIAQQQVLSDANSIHRNIIIKLSKLTREPLESFMIPNQDAQPLIEQIQQQQQQQQQLLQQQNLPTMIYPLPSHGNTTSSPLQLPMSPSLQSSGGLVTPSPTMSPSMSPVINPYYDDGVYSVSGFSITSYNSSNSEGLESQSVGTEQMQQSIMINRRPTFQKSGKGGAQGAGKKIRLGGSDQETFQKTLNAYRLNAKNASDPALQFEYAKFLIEAADDQYDNTAPNKMGKEDLLEEGYKFLKKLSHSGYPDAQHYLATCYKQDNDWDKAYPLFLQAAKHNHPISSYEVASFYESKRNYKKATQYYKKSASQGYPLAMHRLGMATLKGEMHMRKDIRNAVKWLKRAATVATRENNGAAAAFELSEIYEKGLPPVVYPDELYALELLVQAAELDYPPAQFKLGWCFEYGELGCPTDAVQSIHWFLLAAENNEPNAQFSLAGWYLTGAEGIIEPNDNEAFHWASKAAEQSFVKAEYAVAYFFEMGIGTEKDEKEALKWYKIAADHGDQRAIQRLENSDSKKNNNGKSNSDCKIS